MNNYMNNEGTAYTYNRIESFLQPKSLAEVINALERNGACPQRELAERLHLTPTALANRVSKILKFEVKLLEVEQSGRNRIYSLSSICREYLRSVRQSEGPLPKIEPDEVHDPLFQDAKSSLTEFKDKYSDKWAHCLNRELIRRVQGGSCSLDEMGKTLVSRLIRSVELSQKNDSVLDRILELLPEAAREDIEEIINLYHPLDILSDSLEHGDNVFELGMLIESAFSGQEEKRVLESLYVVGWSIDQYRELKNVAEQIMKSLKKYDGQEMNSYFNELLPGRQVVSAYIAKCVYDSTIDRT